MLSSWEKDKIGNGKGEVFILENLTKSTFFGMGSAGGAMLKRLEFRRKFLEQEQWVRSVVLAEAA